MAVKITLEAARINAGLTQRELGEKIGKSEFTIANWESGKTQPRVGDFNLLCLALNVERDQIILPITSRWS